LSNAVKRWIELARRPDIVKRSARVALVVGTLLAIINHGARLLDLDVDAEIALKIGLTYLVPYCVSTWASVQTASREQAS
jgi:hypothetical protein